MAHNEQLTLNIEGAKAGSGKAKTPFRENDTVSTVAKMTILYGIAEGVLRGFGENWTLDDLKKRLYLDGTPVMAQDGTVMQEVDVEFRDGSVQQLPLQGLPSQTIETPINLEVRSSTPIARSFTRPEVDSFEVRISIARLYSGDIEGNSRKGTVTFAIDVATDSGSFAEYGQYTINEKISQGFQRTYAVKTPKAGTRSIRVRKITPDSTSEFVANSIVLEAITEVVEVQFTYPHTALLLLTYDARNYSSVPKMELLVDGKSDIKIPANYDPITRTYATTGVGTTGGLWDGTFKTGYTDNPVWHWLDLATSKRYSIGSRISIDIPDKFYLYSLSKYCDALVPDGAGGQEPRFTCNNLVLQKANDAFQVFKDLSSIFRAKTVWDGSHLTPRMDVPRDATLVFSRANTRDVKYATVSDDAQHNLIGVQFYDTDNQYKSRYVYSRDLNDIKQRGRIVSTDVTALGCTSQGQAQRMAEYLLNSEMKETRIVTFTTGLDGLRPTIGDVFIFADDMMAGKSTSGRVVAVDGVTITLDRPLDPKLDLGGTLVVNTTEQFASTRTVTAISADNPAVVTVDKPITVVDVTGLVWAVRSENVGLSEYVIDDVSFDSEAKTFAISGVQFARDKFPASDGAARIENAPVTIIDPLMPKSPQSVSATYHTVVDQGNNIAIIDVSWSQNLKAVYYEIEMSRDGGSWQALGKVTSLSFEVANAYQGSYIFRVRAIDSLDNYSPYTQSNALLVEGKVSPPPQLAALYLTPKLFGVTANWNFPTGAADSRATRLAISVGADPTQSNVTPTIVDVAYPSATFTLDGLQGNTDVWVQGALVDSYGNVGSYTDWVQSRTSADPAIILDALKGSIGVQQITAELDKKIEDASSNANAASETASQAAKAAADARVAADKATTEASAAKDAASSAAANATTAQTDAQNALAEARKASDLTATETKDRQAAIESLSDGLSTESQERKNADGELSKTIENNKSTTDAAVANLRETTQTQATEISANSQKLTELDTSIKGLATNTALENLQSQVNKQGDNITTNNNRLTSLESTVNDSTTGVAATATGLRNLSDTVSVIDGKVESTASDLLDLRAVVQNNKAEAQQTFATKTDLSTSEANTQTTLRTEYQNADAAVQSNAAVDASNKANSAYTNSVAYVQNYAYSKSDADKAVSGSIEKYDAQLEIGGRNLARNSNFATGDSSWWNVNSPTKKVDIQPSGDVRIGNYAFVETNSSGGGFFTGPVGGWEAGATYTASAWFRNVTDTGVIFNAEGQTELISGNNHIDVSDPRWVWRKVTLTFKKNDAQGAFIVYTDKDGSYDIANFKIEKGNKATDWTPAPEDTNAQINNVQANLTSFQQAQASTDSAQTQRLDTADSRLNDNTSQIQNLQSTKAGKDEVVSIAQQSLQSVWQDDARKEVSKVSGGGTNLLNGTAGGQNTTELYKGQGVTQVDIVGNTTNDFWAQSLPLADGTEYVLSFDAMSDTDGAVLRSYFYNPNTTTGMVNIQGDSNNNSDGSSTLHLTTGWKRYWVKWKQTPTTTGKSVIAARGFGFDGKTTRFKISRVMLETGNVPSDWSPSPQDNAGQLTSLASTIADTYQTKSDAQSTAATFTQQLNSKASQDALNSTNANIVNTYATKAQLADTDTKATNAASATLTLKSTVQALALGGANLMVNSDFSTGSKDNGWNFNGVNSTYDINVNAGAPADYFIHAGQSKTLVVHRIGVSGQPPYIDVTQAGIATEGGKIYQLSAYTSAHRNTSKIFCWFTDKDGNDIGNSFDQATASSVNRQETAGGDLLVNMKRIYQNVKVPNNCASITFSIRVDEQGDDPYLFMTRAMTCEVQTLDSGLVPWAESAAGNAVAIQQQAEVSNGINAKWTIKIDNNGYSTGFGLISTPNNGSITSAFKINADAFVVGKDNLSIQPMIVTTTGQTINGQYYPAGAWFNTVGIADASIKLAHIDTASINNLSALSAIIGTLGTATRGLVVSDDYIKVFDPTNNGIKRVQLGNLDK